MDAWPDYQIVIIRPKKEVRAQATEYQAGHALDGLSVNERTEAGGWEEQPWHP